MINSLGFIGDLFQFNPYDQESTNWNYYPWVVGYDNPIGVSSELSLIDSSKMIWRVPDPMSSIGLVSSLYQMKFDFTLFKMDNYGGTGAASGQNPCFSPDHYRKNILTTSAYLEVPICEQVIFPPVETGNAGSGGAFSSGSMLSFSGSLLHVNTEEVLLVRDSNSEAIDSGEGLSTNARLISVTSEPI